MKLVNQDENWLYYEDEFESCGKKYKMTYTKCKICEKTNLPMHLSKQRIRFSKDPRINNDCSR